MEFELSAHFEVSPEEIFKTWLDSEGHTNMTGGAAEISDQIGVEFTAWDGYIEGKNLDIEPHSRILQSWRAAEFEEEHEDSEIEILLKESANGCELILRHKKLPDSIGEQYIKGWEEFYFAPMKEYFGAR